FFLLTLYLIQFTTTRQMLSACTFFFTCVYFRLYLAAIEKQISDCRWHAVSHNRKSCKSTGDQASAAAAAADVHKLKLRLRKLDLAARLFSVCNQITSTINGGK